MYEAEVKTGAVAKETFPINCPDGGVIDEQL
jgi:hypothetical protein